MARSALATERRLSLYREEQEVAMRVTSLVFSLVFAAALAVLAGACTANSYGYGPYYRPSQSYAYPTGYGYYAPAPNYHPAYGAPYYGSGPSITFTFPQGSMP
jgi:hypothetical protein